MICLTDEFPHKNVFHQCKFNPSDTFKYLFLDFFSKKDLRSSKNLNIFFDNIPNITDVNTLNIIIRTEPISVAPKLWLSNPSSNVEFFDLGKYNSSLGIFLKWPIHHCAFNLKHNLIAKQRIQKAIIISSRKFSLFNQNNYELRYELISDSNFDGLVFGGSGWDKFINLRTFIGPIRDKIFLGYGDNSKLTGSNFRTFFPVGNQKYLGTIQNKIEILNNYELSLVIENDMSYVSEKFIESLVTGAAVVYVGPELKNFNVPDDVFVQCDPDANKIKYEVNSLLKDKKKLLLIQKKARDWILSNDPNFLDWNEKKFWPFLFKNF